MPTCTTVTPVFTNENRQAGLAWAESLSVGATNVPDNPADEVNLRASRRGAVGVASAVECCEVNASRRSRIALPVTVDGMWANRKPAVVPFCVAANTVAWTSARR